jgi:hypothetical protein
MEKTFTPLVTLTHAMTDTSLFGNTFAAASFWTWKVCAKLIDGIPLSEQREIDLFEQATGRTYNRQARRAKETVRHLLLLCGRRAGKDRFLSAVGVWRCALCADWRKFQSAGEGAVVILLGRDKKQAAILRRYCRGLLQVPALAEQVVRETSEVIEFRNGSSLEITSNDVGLVRGRSAIAVLGSECCHWRTAEYAASSDEEVVGAAIPSMAMCPDGGLLVLGSSVYRKRGYMFRQYRELFGNNDTDDLVWFAPSKTMNPALPSWVVDKAMAADPHKAGAEFLNLWREDLSECYPIDAVEGCTDINIFERPRVPGTVYRAYQDAASGGGSDSFTLAIAHRDAGSSIAVLDLLRERKPRFVAYEVIAEFAKILKHYGIGEIYGDRYSFQLFSDEWRKHAITVREPETSTNTSSNYLRGLPLVLGRRARLLTNTTLKNQLLSLERRVVDGHEVVDHPKVAGAHDDVAAAAIGALVTVAHRSGYRLDVFMPDFVDEDRKPPPTEQQKPAIPPEAYYGTAQWHKAMPRQPETYSANERLASLYRGLDRGFKNGF